VLATRFDTLFREEMEGVRDFLILHYRFTAGRTEPMWRHCQQTMMPDTLTGKLDHYRASGRIMLDSQELFRDASWFSVLNGQGIRATDYNPMLDALSDADNLRQVEGLRAAIREAAGQLPALA
jgi:tryptophan 7-halogenase